MTQAQWLSTKIKNSPTPWVITIWMDKYYYGHKCTEQEMGLRTALSWDRGQFWGDATQRET